MRTILLTLYIARDVINSKDDLYAAITCALFGVNAAILLGNILR